MIADVFTTYNVFVPAKGNWGELEMPTEIPVTIIDRDAVHPRMTSKMFADDFYAVALFSGIGLLITVVAVLCDVQGEWF